MSFKKNVKIKFLLLALILSSHAYGLKFNAPKDGESVVGQLKIAQVREDEDFSDVAHRFDVGYYEIFEANPGVDPDEPEAGTVLIIPTFYILPTELKNNTMVINLAEMRLFYKTKKGDGIYIFPVGIGRVDWQTPTGNMTIVEKRKDPIWTVPLSIQKYRLSMGESAPKVVLPGPDNPLGNYAMRLSNRKYLIHGTNAPFGVGRRSTAGCIRLYNEDIEQLYGLVDIGVKVIIINKPHKVGLLGKRLYLESHMPLSEQRVDGRDDTQHALNIVSEVITKNISTKINWNRAKEIIKEHLSIPRVLNLNS